MSKTIIFSFDDGRLDTFTNAVSILKKYNMTCTINVVSDFILHPEKYTEFASSYNKSMSVSNLLECQNLGMEIACHGHTHHNTISDIEYNICELSNLGINTDSFGFASPHSQITHQNLDEIEPLLDNGKLLYVRSGIQVRREGYLYSVLYALQEFIHSKKLYYYLNRKNIFLVNGRSKLIYGITVTKNTTLKQLKYLLKHIPEGYCAVLLFHSILYPEDAGYGRDKWFWDAREFDKLCKYVSEDNTFNIIRTSNLFQGDNEKCIRSNECKLKQSDSLAHQVIITPYLQHMNGFVS
jgi:hypothetical protein